MSYLIAPLTGLYNCFYMKYFRFDNGYSRLSEKHQLRICEKVPEGIKKEEEICRGKIEDCSEAKIYGGFKCC